jgi:hypothetical protein
MNNLPLETAQEPTGNKMIQVVDKPTFRQWCNEMQLNPKQAAVIFNLSVSNIYKYLSEDEGKSLKGPVLLACDLMNTLSKRTRPQKIRALLMNSPKVGQWPSKKPIKYTAE